MLKGLYYISFIFLLTTTTAKAQEEDANLIMSAEMKTIGYSSHFMATEQVVNIGFDSNHDEEGWAFNFLFGLGYGVVNVYPDLYLSFSWNMEAGPVCRVKWFRVAPVFRFSAHFVYDGQIYMHEIGGAIRMGFKLNEWLILDVSGGMNEIRHQKPHSSPFDSRDDPGWTASGGLIFDL